MAGNNIMMLTRLEWMSEAACSDEDPEKFHDIEVKSLSEVQSIVDMCAECEVRSECRAYGEHIRPRPQNVVYGGLYFRGSNKTDPLRVRRVKKVREYV